MKFFLHAIYSFIILFFILGCDPYGSSVNKIDTPKAPIDIKQEGASSGGGGYSQQATHQMLDIVKKSLAEKILNLPEEFFINFPQEYKQDKIATIINNIEFKPDDRRQRDGSFLKMDYDKDTDTLIATYDFYVIYNFPSFLSLARKPEKFVEAYEDIEIDILHELSHLLGIGTSAKSNFTSEVFSNEFLFTMKSVRYVCENEKLRMGFYPYKKTLFLETKNKNYRYSGLIEDMKNYPIDDANLEEFLGNEDNASALLDNNYNFWSGFQVDLLTNYFTAEGFGSASLWAEGVKDIYRADSNELESKTYGFIFENTDENGLRFESKILDKWRESSSSDEKVSYGEYSQDVKTHLEFNSDFSKARWNYDLKVEFVDGLTPKQLEHLEEAKIRRGEFNVAEDFTCEAKVKPFLLEPFLKYPVESVHSPNFIKLTEFYK